MKRYFWICILVCSVNCFAQKIIKAEKVTDHSTYIIGDKFEGVIFSKNYGPDSIIKFTPTQEEILTAEKALVIGLNNAVKDKRLQFNAKAVKSHLNTSFRQYFGYFNAKHEKIILISCFPKDVMEMMMEPKNKKAVPQWFRERISFFDGGASFWRMSFNIDTKKMFGFNVNGVA